jgi:hypothetical protein
MTDHTALKEAAEAATPGPWSPGHFANDLHSCDCKSVLCENYFGAICTVHVSYTRQLEEGDNPPPDEAKANLRFIALANPSKILELLAENEALREEKAKPFRGPLWCQLPYEAVDDDPCPAKCDPKGACGAVYMHKQEAIDAGIEWHKLELATLRKQLREMREALEPFAKLVDEVAIEREFQPGLVSALRRARALMEKQS